MEQNKDNFSPEQIRHLAHSDAAKRLMAMLDRDTAAAVQKSAAAGDMQAAQQAIHAFLRDPRAQALLKQLEEQSHG